MSRVALWKFNEGTGTTANDSLANPVNLTITSAGTSSWNNVLGQGWTSDGSAGNKVVSASLSGTKIASQFAGSKSGTWIICLKTSGSGANVIGAIATAADNSVFEIYADRIYFGGAIGYFAAPLQTAIATGKTVILQVSIDSALASGRTIWYVNGAAGVSTDGLPQNTIIDAADSLTSCFVSFTSDPSGNARTATTLYAAALFTEQRSAIQSLQYALIWAGDNDSDPEDSTLPVIIAADPNGSGHDASTSSSDHTIGFNITIPASGSNRVLVVGFQYVNFSTGITSCTYNGVSMIRAKQRTQSTQGTEIWYLLDAALPSSAGTYAVAATVDGGSGALAGNGACFTNMAQQAPTNMGDNAATGTSFTINLGSNVSAKSIVFDSTIIASGTPVVGDGQIDNGGSTYHNTSPAAWQPCSSIRYFSTSGAASMSWSTTGSTAKVGAIVEFAVMPSFVGIPIYYIAA